MLTYFNISFANIFGFLLLFLACFASYAQDKDSTDTEDSVETKTQLAAPKLNDVQEILHRYEQADFFYRQGKLDSAIKILAPYLKDKKLLRKYDKTGKSEVYRLAAMNYILLDSLEEAEKSIKNVLAARHNYEIRQGDLLSFKAALDTMYISPRLTLGFNLGWTGTIVTKEQSYSVLYIAGEGNPEKYEINLIGSSFGLNIGYYLNRHFALGAGFNFTNVGFDYNTSLPQLGATIVYNYSTMISYIDAPIFLRYKLFLKPYFSPYVFVGGFYRFTGSASKNVASTSIDITPLMQAHNYGGLAGIGISKSMGKRWNISLDGRYLYNLGLINKPDKRFMNNGGGNIDVTLYGRYDVIDDLRMQNFQVNVSVAYLLKYKVF
jgi:hypothetical protein